MRRQQSQLQQMKPYIVVAGILLLLLIIVFFWPSSDQPTVEQSQPVAVVETPPIEQLPPEETIADDNLIGDEPSEEYLPLPEMQEVVIGEQSDASVEVEDATPVTDVEEDIPAPLDISDSAILTALQPVFSSPALTRLMVTDGLLQKFVINVNDLSNGSSSPRNELVVPPQDAFKVYQQAGNTYVDPGSFRRYSPYVSVLESMDAKALVALYEDYREEIELRYEEISRPGERFDDSLIIAIDTLLNTPTLPVPYEVYSDSVMYKFKDTFIEDLPEPQKQLLRTGPDNMRRIKAVLRNVRAELDK